MTFSSLTLLPSDPLFSLFAEFRADPNPRKINLGIGMYTSESGTSFVLPVVQSIARSLGTDNYDYAPIGGIPEYLEEAGRLVFGESWNSAMFVSQATCGGTHACRVFADLAKRAGYTNFLLSDPTWINYKNIFSDLHVISFQHLDEDGSVNIEGYRQAIHEVHHDGILLLQGGSAHNPTGRNLSLDQVRSLIPDIKLHRFCVFIDLAYLGLGDGFEEDVQSVRLLSQELDDVAVAFSFSKNATLYCHRTGALFLKTRNKNITESHVRALIRASVSNTPAFGQAIMRELLSHHLEEWKQQVNGMCQSLSCRRDALCSAIPAFASISEARGLFALLPITSEQSHELRQRFSVYIPESGRVNVAGIAFDRLDDLVTAFTSVL